MKILPLFALALGLAARAQTSPPAPPISASVLQDEPLTLPALIYPAAAKAARIQGIVALEVTVAATGQVTGVRALSGPTLLRQAAIETYSQATYKPLLVNGRPAPAVISTSVNFSLTELPPDTDLLRRRAFTPLHQRCQALAAAKDPEEVDACRKALDAANTFTANYDAREHADAYNDLVLALIDAKRRPEAIPFGEEAVTRFVDPNPAVTHHSEAAATAFITRAEIRSLTKDLKGSAADCAAAEEILRTLLQDEAEVDRAATLRGQLQETLLLHAVVLDQLGDRLEAHKLRNQSKHV